MTVLLKIIAKRLSKTMGLECLHTNSINLSKGRGSQSKASRRLKLFT